MAAPFARRIAFARSRSSESASQFLAHHRKIALNPGLAPNQHMVCTGHALVRQKFAQKRAKPALHPVAHHCVADFLGDGNAKAQQRLFARALVYQKHKSGPCDPDGMICGQKVRPLGNDGKLQIRARSAVTNKLDRRKRLFRLDQADSFLRPRARRARKMFRPPTVAVRARKPWRRARTRLLG